MGYGMKGIVGERMMIVENVSSGITRLTSLVSTEDVDNNGKIKNTIEEIVNGDRREDSGWNHGI